MKTLKLLEQQLKDAENKASELRKQIEAEKKKNAPKDIRDEISGYPDILKKLGADEKKDVIKIDKFDDGDIAFLEAVIKKVRICKVYNGRLPKKGDTRWYNWYNLSSGFDFDYASCDDSCANANSASRLSFLESKHNDDFRKKFMDVDEAIIDVK